MPRIHIKTLIFITLLIILGLVGGCSISAKKPIQPVPPPTPFSYQDASPAPMAKTSINPIYPLEITNQAVVEARKISGVEEASAFANDKYIFVGLDLKEDGNQKKGLVIEKNVMNQINGMWSGYIVRVTSDIDTVKLIKTVSQGIAQGRSISDFNNEVNTIVIKLTPKGSRLLYIQ